MRNFEEDEFNHWLGKDYQRQWRSASMHGWIGSRSIDQAKNRYMLLARMQLQNGIQAVYGEFRPAQETLVHLSGNELLLTFFIEGDIKGYNRNLILAPYETPDRNLLFAPHQMILRRPNSAQGSSVVIQPDQTSRFLQLRMIQGEYFNWLESLDLGINSNTLDSLVGQDGEVIYRGPWTVNIVAALQPWKSIVAMRTAMLPFLAAKSWELLTLFSLEFHARSALTTRIQNTNKLEIEQILTIARQTIAQNLHDLPTLERLSIACRVSVSSLKRWHTQLYGESFSDYSLRLRMQAAHALLEQSTLTIGEVAGRVSYSNSSRFVTAFINRFGCSPKQLRHNRRVSI